MKFIASAALTLLVLVSGQSFAEQTPNAGQQNNRDNDYAVHAKPVALGLQSHGRWQRQIRRIRRAVLQPRPVIRFCPANAGLFSALTPHPRCPTHPQAKDVDIQPGHNQPCATQLQRAERFIQQQCGAGKPDHRYQQR